MWCDCGSKPREGSIVLGRGRVKRTGLVKGLDFKGGQKKWSWEGEESTKTEFFRPNIHFLALFFGPLTLSYHFACIIKPVGGLFPIERGCRHKFLPLARKKSAPWKSKFWGSKLSKKLVKFAFSDKKGRESIFYPGGGCCFWCLGVNSSNKCFQK